MGDSKMYLNKEFQNICHNIRWLRAHHGLSRSAMARKLHITVKSLDLLEAGVIPQRIRIDFLFFAQQAFNIPVKNLVMCRLTEDV